MSNHPSTSGSGDGSIPRGLLGRRGGPIGQGARLPSLRSPRDLTLGGVAKRTFAPTIPVRKERNKNSDAKSEAVSRNSKPQRGRGGDRGHGRGRGRGRPEIVQLQGGVFCDGPAERMLRKSFGDRASGESDYLPKPKIDFKQEIKYNKEEEKQTLSELLRDDLLDYRDDEELKHLPVKLPLKPHKGSVKCKAEVKEMKSEKEIKSEPQDSFLTVKIKNEPLGADEIAKSSTITNHEIDRSHEKSDVLNDISCSELLYTLRQLGREELLFFQLPDTLPVLPKSKEDEKPKVKQEPGIGFGHGHGPESTVPDGSLSQPGNSDEKKSDFTSTLSNVSEGYLGKLKVWKSGKTTLDFGNVTLNVEMGTQVGFLQDAVSLDVKDNGGHLTVLGHMQYRLICTPEMVMLCQ